MSFGEQALLAALQAPAEHNYCVAFSGGRDSAALLHAAVLLREQGLLHSLRALHVDHGLHAEAEAWAAHCAQFCAARDVPLRVVRAQVTASGAGLEADARRARYRLFEAELADGAVLLQAHHADDQAETFLLRALRGAGVRGLRGMPQRRVLGAGWLERPLLGVTRARITEWAEAQSLQWVEDPGNGQSDQDRNFLRNDVLPLLRQRWPATTDSFGQAAGHCEDAEHIVRMAAERALDGARSGSGGLHLRMFRQIEPVLQKEVLRSWAAALGLPAPGQQALRRMIDEVAAAREDAVPLVVWGGAEVRRFAETLYAASPLPPPPAPRVWDGAQRINLGRGCGALRIEPVTQGGLRPDCLVPGQTEIRFRVGGERCHPLGRSGSHPLKQLLQELRVAPWLRDRVPLLVQEGRIVSAAGLFLAQGCQAEGGAPGLRVVWEPDPVIAAPLEHARWMKGPSSD